MKKSVPRHKKTIIKEKREAYDTPKEMRILIQNNQTGEVLADYVTDVAIICGFIKESPKLTPLITSIMFIGNGGQLIKLLQIASAQVFSFVQRELKLQRQSKQPQEKEMTN